MTTAHIGLGDAIDDAPIRVTDNVKIIEIATVKKRGPLNLTLGG